MKKSIAILALLGCIFVDRAFAKESSVGANELNTVVSAARPGDVIRVASGTYRDVELKIAAHGTKEAPIVIEAEKSGEVILSGASNLRLAGEWITVRGLRFEDGYSPSGAVIEYRLGRQTANDCRITECAVVDYNPSKRAFQYSYVQMHGRHNRFDHNALEGKLNLGVTLVVMLDREIDQQNFHSIDHNYFGFRHVYGSNGAETIRVGVSQQSHTSSHTLIANNVFERCNGEVEAVSIKSSDNIIRGNLFYECEGVLALRHGDRNIVENNMFIGNDVRNTGGVRVINAGHVIRDNTFYGLAGERFFSALALMDAVPNSLASRYNLVEDITIENNTFIGCREIGFGVGRDQERTLPPTRILFAGNTIYNPEADELFNIVDDISGFTFRDNRAMLRTKRKDLPAGVKWVNMKRPVLPAAPVSRDQVGPAWYVKGSAEKARPVAEPRIIKVMPGEDALCEAVDGSAPGDIVELALEGDYPISRGVRVSHPLTIRAAGGLATRPVVRFVGESAANMITIIDGGSLTVSGISFDGALEAGKSIPSAGIATLDGMIEPYSLTVEDCEFANFESGGNSPIKGKKNTFADKVTVRGSLFRDMVPTAIDYSGERDDIGRYNAEDVIVEDCVFYRVQGIAVNVYRGGSDESTAGPYVTVRDCIFENVCNMERGSVLRLIGPQVLDITGCTFSNSGRGGGSIRLDEAVWEKISISDCNFWNSGRIITITNNVVKGPLYEFEPQYRDRENLDFRQIDPASTVEGEVSAKGTGHPSLLLTSGGVASIRRSSGRNEIFDRSLEQTRSDADKALGESIEIPVPRDGGGGYTHEKHKDNYYAMFNCGMMYQITGEEKYARFVADMLAGYAELYPTLSSHPVVLSSTPGRLFWQTLNESVWLVHASVAYDCVYDYIGAEQRERIENDLFRPMADFLMNEGANNAKFNSMHNHGTWATAGVGMIGFAMKDDDLVRRAIYGSDGTGETGGFLRQLRELFSPDGYFTEGVYYMRYAIWPFVLFAQAIDNNRPELDIFAYRDGVILRAVNTLVQLAYQGRFFTFNDYLDKGYDAQELVYAIDIAYKADPTNKQLLSVAADFQDRVLPTDAGYAVARDIASGQAEPLGLPSLLLGDGADGKKGGVAVLRDDEQGSALVFKASAHGLSHGHYDKLSISYFDNGNPVLEDYGAARFVNIEAKYKGHYTPENKSFAMTTIAHNTVTVDETSHFGGVYGESMKHASQIYCFDVQPGFRVVSGKENEAYPDVDMHRTVAVIDSELTEHPLIVDLFRLTSESTHTYDYPFWFNGHVISLDFPYRRSLSSMGTLGDGAGYKHLWVEASGKSDDPLACFTFLTGNRFYSINTLTDTDSEMYIVSSGADDPNFHLLDRNGYMVRHKGDGNHVFLSTMESHGEYDLVMEQTSNATSSVKNLEVIVDTPEYTVVGITLATGTINLAIANENADPNARHTLDTPFGKLSWRGVYDYKITNN